MKEKNSQKNELKNHTVKDYLFNVGTTMKISKPNGLAIEFRKKYTVLATVSIMTVFLFIGTIMTSAIAGSLTPLEDRNVDDLCSKATYFQDNSDKPICETCNEAVEFALEYAVKYANKNTPDINPTYPVAGIIEVFTLWTEHFSKGIVKGFQESGFELPVDLNDMLKEGKNAAARYTTFPGKTIAFIAAITNYLLEICNDLKC